MDNPSEPACQLVRADDTYDGKQGLPYFCGIAAETVGRYLHASAHHSAGRKGESSYA